jgi:hypothetical protein
MTINLLKKLVSSVVQPEVAGPTQRKPPQRVDLVDVSPSQAGELSGSRIPCVLPRKQVENTPIPATWNEVIGNPRIWAEIRPLIVDED